MEVTLKSKELSRHMSCHLNDLGFSQREKWERILHISRLSIVKHLALRKCLNNNNDHVFAGSLIEGISFVGMSDLDCLQIDNRVGCTGKSVSKRKTRTQLGFQIITQNVPAGYCFLKLIRPCLCPDIVDKFKYAFVEQGKDGEVFLSSKLFVTESDDDMFKLSKYIRNEIYFDKPHGPSQPRVYFGPELEALMSDNYMIAHTDFVRCFPCHETSVLRRWSNRQRSTSWPNKKMIEKVLNLQVYVVPVGKCGSFKADLQWRMSFVRAETYLVQMFNGTQTMILMILKLVAKHYIQPVCGDITSYVVKNIMLWLVETIPRRKFRRRHLIARLTDSLNKLREAVLLKGLPSYMQPEKNLFSGKLEFYKQQEVLIKLDYLLQTGNRLITIYLFEKSFVNDKYTDIGNLIDKTHKMMQIQTRYYAMYSTKTLVKNFISEHQLTSRIEKCLFLLSGAPRFLYTYDLKALDTTLPKRLRSNLEEGVKIRKMVEESDEEPFEYECCKKSFTERVFSLLCETQELKLSNTDRDFEDFLKFAIGYYGNEYLISVYILMMLIYIAWDQYMLCIHFLLLLIVSSLFGDKLWMNVSLLCVCYVAVQFIQLAFHMLYIEGMAITDIRFREQLDYILDYLMLVHLLHFFRICNMLLVFVCFILEPLNYLLQKCV